MGGFQDLLSKLMGGGYQGVGADTGGNTVSVGPNQYYRAPTVNTLGPENYWGSLAGAPADYNAAAMYGYPGGAGNIAKYSGGYMLQPNGTYQKNWNVNPLWNQTMESNWQATGGRMPLLASGAPGMGTNTSFAPSGVMNQYTPPGILPGLQSTAGAAPSIYTAQNIMAGNVPQPRIGSGGFTGASGNRTGGAGGRIDSSGYTRPVSPVTTANPYATGGAGRTGGAGATAGTGGGRNQAPGGNNYQVESQFPQNPVNMNNAINTPSPFMASNPLLGYYLQNPTNTYTNPIMSNPLVLALISQYLGGSGQQGTGWGPLNLNFRIPSVFNDFGWRP